MRKTFSPLPLLLAAVALLAGCCLFGRPIDQDVFAASTLEVKIRLYEGAVARKCVTNDMLQLLSAIASHGESAADAMAMIFASPRPDFPFEHAVFVFEFTRFEGVDLLEHRGMGALRRLAETESDRKTRETARQAIGKIESYYAE